MQTSSKVGTILISSTLLAFVNVVVIPNHLKLHYKSAQQIQFEKSTEDLKSWNNSIDAWRKVQASEIEIQHNEAYLAGINKPDVFLDKTDLFDKDSRGRTIHIAKDRYAKISETSKLLKTLYQSTKYSFPNPIDNKDNVVSGYVDPVFYKRARLAIDQVLQTEANGIRDLEYVECIRGVNCYFSGPLAALNDFEHTAKLLMEKRPGGVYEVKGASDFPPDIGKQPVPVEVFGSDKVSVPENVKTNILFLRGFLISLWFSVLAFMFGWTPIKNAYEKRKNKTRPIIHNNLNSDNKGAYRATMCQTCQRPL